MVFSSVVFLYYFLPIVLVGYHLLFLPVTLGWRPVFWRRASNTFLLALSLLFYFWGENFLLWIVICSTAIDYVCGLIISRGYRRGEIEKLEIGGTRTTRHRIGLVLSLVSNLAFLGFFKYFNFFVENFNWAMSTAGLSGARWEDFVRITLPLGISFYTFQSMSYTIDVYRGEVKATRNFLDFACYVTMFPQLVAGPIVRYRDVALQLVNRVVTAPLFASGIRRFVIGLAKKILIANIVAVAADDIFAVPSGDLTPALAWLGIISYTLQIYFDFSGYSDMAIGLGRMFGFDFLENFNYPYISQTIQEFWRRWHISLSTWFRDYLYIPLGGSRKRSGRTYFNLVTVFFLCGLWHGAAWNFVVWGLFHGTFLVIERIGFAEVLKKVPRPLRHLYTLIVAVVGWVFFRADSLGQSISYLGSMLLINGGDPLRQPLAMYVRPELVLAIVAGCVGSAPVLPLVLKKIRRSIDASDGSRHVLDWLYCGLTLSGIAILMLTIGMRLASGSHNPFIYFRF